jgi:hypothetical protein
MAFEAFKPAELSAYLKRIPAADALLGDGELTVAEIGDCLWLAEALHERTACLLASQLGEPPLLSDVQMAEVIERFKGYGRAWQEQ